MLLRHRHRQLLFFFVLQVLRIQGDDASSQSLVLGSNCRKRSLTKASTNGVVALDAWYSRMEAISKICLNN